ncbi:MAG: protein kinase domain-containing protein [Thermoanaerobaculia bacterium]
MSLASGTRLGTYEILSPLGAGGMGEVYRARDSKLDRDVAIKILPERLANDADSLTRFEREAKAVAALSHPNILGIFDFGKHDGVVYAVMELLDGETLRDKLSAPIPLRKAIEYSVQIAQGLAAAHEKGIVHRDLKPENLFVTADGRVKILDFGLARVLPAEAAATNAPTAALGTEPGVVMGTVGYMSPEQVRARPADHRSDIFSFGAILYEMLSGKRAFRGDSAAETMAAIANTDPPELSASSPNISSALDGIVRHCLEKSPSERFQSARDLAFDLQAVSASSSMRSGGAAAARGGKSFRVPALGAAGVLLAGAAALALSYRLGLTAGGRHAREHPPKFQRLTFRRGNILEGRFSSDGKTIIYSAAWQGEPPSLYSVRATAPQSQKLDLPPAMLYSVSRSDELLIGLGWHYLIGFTSEATLARTTISGGAPRPVLERVVSADWGPDGQTMAVSRFVGESDVLEYPIGHVLYSTVSWLDSVHVSPDGSRVAFADHGIRGDSAGDLVVVDRQGKAKRLVRGAKNVGGLVWSPDGREIRWSGNRTGNKSDLYATDLSGRERPIFASGSSAQFLDSSPSGEDLMVQTSPRREVHVVTRDSLAERDLSWLDWSFPTDLSADGKRILISEQGDATKEDYLLYLRPTDGSPGIEVGLGLGSTISPDGRFVASVRRNGDEKLMFYPTGIGQPREIAFPGLKPIWACWYPDGRRILVSADAPGHPAGLYEKNIESGALRAISSPPMNPFHFRVSPDGETVAGTSPDLRITLVSLRTGVSRALPEELEAGDMLAWSSDGRSLYYQDRTPMPAKIYRVEIATGRRELVRELRPQDPAGVLGIGPVFTTPDGATVAFSFRRILDELFLVDGLR